MSNIVSAGVYPRVVDRSFGTPAVSDSVGAIVINSNKGPTEVTTVTSRRRFIELYGEPTGDTPSKHCAIRFLLESNRLNVLRVINDAEPARRMIYTDDAETAGNETFEVIAANPGDWGNNIEVRFEDTTQDDIFRMFIYYNGELVESFDVSKDSTKKNGFGRSVYIEDVVNNQSDFVVVEDDTSNPDEPFFESTKTLENGTDDTTPVSDAEVTSGWDEFLNKDDVNANILINAGWAAPSVQLKMNEVASNRNDCVAVLDFPEADADSVASMVEYITNDLTISSSWSAIYGSWIRIYDEYNDREVYIPPSGDVAGIYARTSSVAEPWSAPAGTRRGTLNVLGVKKNLSQGERDELYENNINPIVNFSGTGVVVWGQKTLQRQPSSLDRVNVRRLVIHIQNVLEPSLKPFVFQPNTAFTRDNIASLIDNFLADVESRQGVTGYNVVVDETNNTPQVIDSNELVIDLFIQPSRSAEIIRLNTILSPSGVTFN